MQPLMKTIGVFFVYLILVLETLTHATSQKYKVNLKVQSQCQSMKSLSKYEVGVHHIEFSFQG